jgi:hypothetical protein
MGTAGEVYQPNDVGGDANISNSICLLKKTTDSMESTNSIDLLKPNDRQEGRLRQLRIVF